MSGNTSIKGTIQELIGMGAKVSVILGAVVSETPLRIRLINDEKITAGGDNLYIPKHLTDYEVEMSIEPSDEKKKMTVYNALKAGERVHLLVFGEGKQFYVLDRVM